VSLSDSDSDDIDGNDEVGVVDDDLDRHRGQNKDDNQTGGDEESVRYDNFTPRVVDVTDGLMASDSKTLCPVESVTDVPDNADAAKLRSEQLADKTLLACFSLAKRNYGWFYFKHGVLHRVDLVAGQTVEQLVLPKNRRQQAIDLAYETCLVRTWVTNPRQSVSLQFLMAYYGTGYKDQCVILR